MTAADLSDWHAAVIDTHGALWVAGDNPHGQLGLGPDAVGATPHVFSAVDCPAMVDVACGTFNTLCVDTEGVLWVAGSNRWGQLVDGGPRHLTELTDTSMEVTAVASGVDHHGVISHGVAHTAGANYRLQLGWGRRGSSDINRGFGPVPLDDEAVGIACGQHHTAIVTAGGTLHTIGSDRDTHTDHEVRNSRVSFPTASPVTKVACAASATVALTGDGTMWFSTGSRAFRPLHWAHPIVDIACASFQVAVDELGNVAMAGVTPDHQLRLGLTLCDGTSSAAGVAAYGSCAIAHGDTVSVYGSDPTGLLGCGTGDQHRFASVELGGPVAELAAELRDGTRLSVTDAYTQARAAFDWSEPHRPAPSQS